MDFIKVSLKLQENGHSGCRFLYIIGQKRLLNSPEISSTDMFEDIFLGQVPVCCRVIGLNRKETSLTTVN